jgi:hypothetical protein
MSMHLSDAWRVFEKVFNKLCGESSDVNSETIEE